MKVEALALRGVVRVVPTCFSDHRGHFFESYTQSRFDAAVAPVHFVQDNQSLSRLAGTIRGLHFQRPPFAQAKLVRVVRGAVLDVAVDLRRSSPTYGQHLAVTLSAADRDQLFVPAGFAHGFCTLEPETEVLYKVDAPYSAAHDAGLHWRDPDLAIDWPVAEPAAILSAKDAALPLLRELGDIFP